MVRRTICAHLDQLEAYRTFLQRNAGRRIELIARVVTDEAAPDPELPKADEPRRAAWPRLGDLEP